MKRNIVTEVAAITDDLVAAMAHLTFGDPVTHVYNPLVYARQGYDRYVSRYGNDTKPVILVGMNPGPFGMAQTGIPFGDVDMVTGYLGIEADITPPADPHPRRPVYGYACARSEVSGRRLWSWARQRYGRPAAFFSRFFILNYCPLVFMEASGRNRTPDKLRRTEKLALFTLCDRAFRRTIRLYQPRWVIGIGAFAQQRATVALAGVDVRIGRITHPSPANPKANRGWAALVESELAALGVREVTGTEVSD